MSCLLIIDVQNDFMKDGSLEVENANDILEPINNIRNNCSFDLIALSKDWHPENHISFASTHNKQPFIDSIITKSNHSQLLFPDHCIQNTKGSEINKDLIIKDNDIIINKGMDIEVDSYSAFYDNDKNSKTELEEILKKHSINKVYVCGLATDFCVLASCLDSVNCGFKTYFIQDCSKGVSKNGVDQSLQQMKNKGIIFINSSDLIQNKIN
ncbi:hypothetical protein RB653_003463 [Dictyostelium firmibasis]|uniref:nicotinamidase n=1 Tax=Dictyostelium firmibasis TaxID=79012 RepID=A0AAN7UHH3_9MYCE